MKWFDIFLLSNMYLFVIFCVYYGVICYFLLIYHPKLIMSMLFLLYN